MNLNSYLDPYLTEEAQQLRACLVEVGFDQDLALAVVEIRMPEEEVFELPTRQQKVTPTWID